MVHKPEHHQLHEHHKHAAHEHEKRHQGHESHAHGEHQHHALNEVHQIMKSAHLAKPADHRAKPEHHAKSERQTHQQQTEHHNPEHKNPPDTLLFSPLYADKHHPVPAHIIDFSNPALHLKGIDGVQHKDQHNDFKQPAAEKPHFDAKKSVEQNIKEGTFKQEADKSIAADHKPLEHGKAPKITIVYENKDANSHAPKPNYIVKKDGSISVVHNPEGPPHDANVVIQVARDTKQTGAPDKAQQKAVDDLVEYQGSRIAEKFGSALKEIPVKQGKLKQVDIDDAQNLVSDTIKQKFGNKLPPDVTKMAPPTVPADVKQTSDLMNRVQGSGGHATVPRESAPGRHQGDASQAGVDQLIPPRTVPQTPKEANSIAAAKDAAAALFNPDRAHPYQTIRENSDHSYRVGRYGLNQGFSMMGLAEMMGVDLGDPPDLAKLQAYLREHPQALEKAIQSYAEKINQDADKAHLAPNDPVRESAKALSHFAKSLDSPQFQNDFVKFMSDMKGDGQAITQDRLNKFMPKELQEVLAEKGIQHEAKLLGENPNKLSDEGAGKITLAFILGRTPTAADAANPQYSDYTRAGSNMYKLAESRMQSLGDINITDAQGKIIAAAGHNVGKAMWQKYLNGGRLGCAASVSAVLNEAGFSYATSIGVSALQDQLVAHGWKVASQPQPGDVVCGYRKPKGIGPGGSAHTGIVGPDGTWDNHSRSQVWSKDPLSAWNRREYPAGVVFLRPPGA